MARIFSETVILSYHSGAVVFMRLYERTYVWVLCGNHSYRRSGLARDFFFLPKRVM